MKPSLSVEGRPDKVLVYCHFCRQGGLLEILGALGLNLSDLFAPSSAPPRPPRQQRRRPIATHQYEDIDGLLQSEKVRYEPKDFRWRSPTPDGGWCPKKAQGVTLFRLPYLIDARLVLVVEGEKSVLRLASLGFVATCPPSGASMWLEIYTEVLWRAGAHEVVVIPDNDRPGRDHARRVVKACHGFRADFTTFHIEPEAPWSTWPCAEADDDEVQPLRAKLLRLEDVPHRGDVCDWLDAGHTADELRALVDAALDLDAVNQAKEERKRWLAAERQRRHRAKIRAAAG